MTKTNHQPPEIEEFEKKTGVLEILESRLYQLELEYATFHGELHAFQLRYSELVVRRMYELDKIEAQISEHLVSSDPNNPDYRRKLREAKERITEAEQEFEREKERKSKKDFKPSEELKRLYRDIARKIHPDLTTNEKEQERRSKLMAEVNEAYADGDQDRLQKILDNWQYGPENIEGTDIGSQLVKLIRKIAQVEKRIAELEEAINSLRNTELFQLKEKVSKSESDGVDMLGNMADYLDVQIYERGQYLDFLRKGGV